MMVLEVDKAMADKVKVRSVTLDRAEGPTAQCIKLTVGSLAEATATLRRWSFSAPRTGGYDKVDFLVTFEDGETYDGRFDMQYNLEGEGSLEEHIQRHLLFIAGLWIPAHMATDEPRYVAFVKQTGSIEAAREMLATYDLGPVEVRPNFDVLVNAPNPSDADQCKAAAAALYKTLTADQRAVVRFGMVPADAVELLEAAGFTSRDIALGLFAAAGESMVA